MKDNQLATSGRSKMLGFLRAKKDGTVAAPRPFEREIFLFDTYIAGTSFVEGLDELEPHLKIGEKLNFLREPSNLYDKKAITIHTANGVKIGYVPRKDNVVFSRLLDAGKVLFARIESKEWEGHWLRCNIKIFLED